MFEKIKKLFLPDEKEPEEVNLRSDELSGWLSGYEKEMFGHTKSKIDAMLAKNKKSQKRCEEQLEALKNAKLKNDNIPKKAEHMMLGHKESFSKRTMGFLIDIDCELDTPEEIFRWTKEIEENMEKLAKTNAKSSYVLNEFFGDQMKILNYEITSIGNVVKEIREVLVKSGFVDIEILRDKIRELSEKEKAKIELQRQRSDAEEKCRQISEQIKSIEKEIKNIKSSQEFKMLEKLKRDRDSFKKEKEQYEKRFTEDIKSVESGLKRYKRLSIDENLISDYIKEPAKTLLKDKELKIIEIIQKLRSVLIDDKIDFKAKKKEKILDNLDRFDARYFTSVQENYERVIRQKQKIDLKLNRNPIMQNLAEEEYKLEHLRTKQKTAELELEIKKKAFQKLDILSLKKEIEKTAKKIDVFLKIS